MTSSWVANDFATIGQRMPEIEAERRCDSVIEQQEEPCPGCEGGGWVQIYSPNPPAFAVCEDCFNPEGHPSP